jgi:hypothetical protein
MSTAATGAAQRAALRRLGLPVVALPELRDVDTIADARAVAARAPHTRFAATLAEVAATAQHARFAAAQAGAAALEGVPA